MVFQHFSLFEALTAAENIALSLDDDTPIAHHRRQGEGACPTATACRSIPYSLVGDLSVGERQRIEIIRCLLQTPQLIILDEPTSVLTPQEADKLFETLERLRSEGKSILYISHRLEEVKRMCDRATVLRHGKVVGHCDPRQETAASLARMMVGSEVQAVVRAPVEGIETAPAAARDPRASAASRRRRSRFRCKNINLNVRAGEVIGIAGVAGNGQGEFFEAVSGEVLQPDAGAVRIRGKDAGGLSITGRRLLGAAFVPEERLGHGAAPRMKLSENLLLSRHATDGKASSAAAAWSRRRDLRGRPAHHRGDGRAQERAAIRKRPRFRAAICRNSSSAANSTASRAVLVVNQPTWGVDAGAAAQYPPGADRACAQRLGGAGHQPGSRRAVRNLGRDRRHAQWRTVEAAADRRSDAAKRSAC